MRKEKQPTKNVNIIEELQSEMKKSGYITSEGAKEEHEVIVKDGYASFETNHFSTYVLAEKAEENPKTYDRIINSIFAGSISLIGLVCVIIYLKKEVM